MLDYSTCTAMDVIKRALQIDTPAYVAMLNEQAKEHYAYARLTGNIAASRAACRMATDCETASLAWNDETLATLPDRTGPYACAFNVACHIALVPRHERSAIMAR